MERDAINLTLIHQWMTVSDAELLLLHAYNRFKKHEKYGGDIVNTLMRVEYGIFQRSSEEHMKARLDLIKSELI